MKNYTILKLGGYIFKYQPLYTLLLLTFYGALKNNKQIKLIIDDGLNDLIKIDSEFLEIEKNIFFQIIDNLCKNFIPIFYHDPAYPDKKFPIVSIKCYTVKEKKQLVQLKLIKTKEIKFERINSDNFKVRFNLDATNTIKDSLLVINFFKGIDMDKGFGLQYGVDY